jgi:phage gpG-like protein
MGTSNQFNFTPIRLAIEKELANLPKDMAIVLQNESVNNINTQSFYGSKWEPAKESEGHPLLNDTGKLLNAVKKSVQTGNKNSKDSFNLAVINDYGLFLNEGTPKMPQRQFMGNSTVLDNKIIKLIDRQLTPKFDIK